MALTALVLLIPASSRAQNVQRPPFLQPTPIYVPKLEIEMPDPVTNMNPPLDQWRSEVSRAWCRNQSIIDAYRDIPMDVPDNCVAYTDPMLGGAAPRYAGLPEGQFIAPHQLIDVPRLFSPFCKIALGGPSGPAPGNLGLQWDFTLGGDYYTYAGCYGWMDPAGVPFVDPNSDVYEATDVLLANSVSDYHIDNDDMVPFLHSAGPQSMDPVNLAFEIDVFPATSEIQGVSGGGPKRYFPISLSSGYVYMPAPPPSQAGTKLKWLVPTTGTFVDTALMWYSNPAFYRAFRKMVPGQDIAYLLRSGDPTEDPNDIRAYVTFMQGQGMNVHLDCARQHLSTACQAECWDGLSTANCGNCLQSNPGIAAQIAQCPHHVAYTETDLSETYELLGTDNPVFIGFITETQHRRRPPPPPINIQTPTPPCSDCSTFSCGPGDTNCGNSCNDCNTGIVTTCKSCGSKTPPPSSCNDCSSFSCGPGDTNCGNSCTDCGTGAVTTCPSCGKVPPPPPPTVDCSDPGTIDTCADYCECTCLDLNERTDCTNWCLYPDTSGNNCESALLTHGLAAFQNCAKNRTEQLTTSSCDTGSTPTTPPPPPPPGSGGFCSPPDQIDSCLHFCECSNCQDVVACGSACAADNCALYLLTSPPNIVGFQNCAKKAANDANAGCDTDWVPEEPTTPPVTPTTPTGGTTPGCNPNCAAFCADAQNCEVSCTPCSTGIAYDCPSCIDHCPKKAGTQKVPPINCVQWCDCIDCDRSGNNCVDLCINNCGSLENGGDPAAFRNCAEPATQGATCFLGQNTTDREFDQYLVQWMDRFGDLLSCEAEAQTPPWPGTTDTAWCNTYCQSTLGAAFNMCTTPCMSQCGTGRDPTFPYWSALTTQQRDDLAACVAVTTGNFVLENANGVDVFHHNDGWLNIANQYGANWKATILGYDMNNPASWDPCEIYVAQAITDKINQNQPGEAIPPYRVRHSSICTGGMPPGPGPGVPAPPGPPGFGTTGTFFVVNRGPVDCWQNLNYRNPDLDSQNGAIQNLSPNYASLDNTTHKIPMYRNGQADGTLEPGSNGENSCGYITFYTVEWVNDQLFVRVWEDPQTGEVLKYPTWLNPTFAAVGDFNGDGDATDIAVTNVGSQEQNIHGGVSVLYCAEAPAGYNGPTNNPYCEGGIVMVDDTMITGQETNSRHPWAISADVLLGKQITAYDWDQVYNSTALNPQPTAELCIDNLDNDGDGDIDCSDTDCAAWCGAVVRAPEDLAITFIDAWKQNQNDFALLLNQINGPLGTTDMKDPNHYKYDINFAAQKYQNEHGSLTTLYNDEDLMAEPIKQLAKDFEAYPLAIDTGLYGETSNYLDLFGATPLLQHLLAHIVPGMEGDVVNPTTGQTVTLGNCNNLMVGFHNSHQVGQFRQTLFNPYTVGNNQYRLCNGAFSLEARDVTDASTPVYNAASSGLAGQGLGWGYQYIHGYFGNSFSERTYGDAGADWLYLQLSPTASNLVWDFEYDFSLDLIGVNGNILKLYETRFIENMVSSGYTLPQDRCEADRFEVASLVQDTFGGQGQGVVPPGSSFVLDVGDDPETPLRCEQRWGGNTAGLICCLLLESPGDKKAIAQISEADLWPNSTFCPYVDPMPCCIEDISSQLGLNSKIVINLNNTNTPVDGWTSVGDEDCALDCIEDLQNQIAMAPDFAAKQPLIWQLNCQCKSSPPAGFDCGPTTTVDCATQFSGNPDMIACCEDPTDTAACCAASFPVDTTMRTCCETNFQDPICKTTTQQQCSCNDYTDPTLRDCCIDQLGSGSQDCPDLLSQFDASQCFPPPPPPPPPPDEPGEPGGACDPNDSNEARAGFAKDFPECCERYDGELVLALSSGDSDCPGGGSDGCNINFTNNGVINGNVQICCECFNISGSHNDVTCAQSCATVYDPIPDPNLCLGRQALNKPLPIECSATCESFPDACQKPGESPKLFCDELVKWNDDTDWSNLQNESKAKANLQGMCLSASGNEKCLGILLHGTAELDLNVGSTLALMGLSLDAIKGQDGVIEIYQTQGVEPESMETDLVGLSFLTTEPGALVRGKTQLVGGATPISGTMSLAMTWPYEEAEGDDKLNKFQVKLVVAGEEIICDTPPVFRSTSVAGGQEGPSKCSLSPNAARGPIDFFGAMLLMTLLGLTTRFAYCRKRRY